MGYASHSVENLGPPFLLVDEMVFVIPKGGEVRLSKHHFKFLFVLSGEIDHEIEGLDGRRALAAGDICAAPVVKYHRYLNPEGVRSSQLHVVRLFLDAEHIEKRAGTRVRHPEMVFTDFVLHHFPRPLHLKKCIDGEITELLTQLRRETERREPGYRHRVRALCVSLIVATARHTPSGQALTEANAPGGAGPLVAAAKEYILKNLGSEMTLGEIAWQVGKGEEHLARVFKRETGQSVFDFVREMRVNQAKTYLLDSTLSLTEIAERCGFSSLSFFSRTFRALAGLPPSAYRQYTETLVRPQNSGTQGRGEEVNGE